MIEPMDFDYSDDHSWDQAGRIACEAYELYEKGQMLEAFEKMLQAIDLNPSCGSWHFNMGLTLDAMERYEEAIECYERALELCGEDVEILNSLAVDCTRTCQYDRALEIFGKIQAIDPNYEPCYCNRIITYTEMDQHEKAEHMFYLAQQLNQDCPICFYNIGNSLFSRGIYDRAIWCWEKTAELDPNHPQIGHRIAQACWASGKTEMALEYFLKEVRRDPGCIEVIFDFGLFLLDIEDWAGGLEKFNRIIELNETFGPAWFYRGEVMLHRGDVLEAEKDYKQAIKLDSKLPGPHFRLAQSAYQDNAYQKALENLHKEFDLRPDDPDVLRSIGWMFAQLGELDSACKCFLLILEQDRNDANACYGLGLCMAIRKNHDTSLQFLKIAVGLEPHNPDYHVAIIWLYIHLKKWEMVEQELKTYKVMFSENKQFLIVYRQLNRYFHVEKFKERLLQNKTVCRLISTWPFLRNYLE